MDINLHESSWQRAKRDTEKLRKDSPIWYWGVEVVGVMAFTGIGLWLTPDQPTKLESILYPSIGAIAGLVIAALLVFIWNLFRAPYRQRNEARTLLTLLTKLKPAPLTNRKELISAIHALKETAQETVQKHRTLRESRRPHTKLETVVLHMKTEEEASKDYDDAFEKYFEARKGLECQQLIATEAVRPPVTVFQDVIDSYVLGNIKNRDTSSDADEDVLSDVDVLSRVEELVAKIDAIS